MESYNNYNFDYAFQKSMVNKIENVSINEAETVHFVEQFVEHVCEFSSQYGNNMSISYVASNIKGPPSKFPNYGDFSQTFAMRTYGLWWDKVPSRSIDYMPQNNSGVTSQDYIDIIFNQTVYPIRVSIYEVYNPGSVIGLWAQDSNHRWFQLWSGPPQIVPQMSRIFSPPLRSCNFETSKLRLEFNHSLLDYYTELDAVMLIGTSELIFPKTQCLKQSLSDLLQSFGFYSPDKDFYNLTPDYTKAQLDLINLKKELHIHCTKYRSGVAKNFHRSRLISEIEQHWRNIPPFTQSHNSMQQFISKDLQNFNNVEALSDESRVSPSGSFSVLPDETILKILKNLDLKSLYRMCRVNKHFGNLARDPFLYTRLNLKPYWHSLDANALRNLENRCEYLRQLDLSWCSNYMISDVNIIQFLNSCCNLLTHLRLNCCDNVSNSVILEISKTCKNLRELCLRNCQNITDEGFVHLKNLEFLECLDLYSTKIKTETLCKILRKNSRLRHLNIADNQRIDANRVALELGNSCPDLESVDFWKVRTLLLQGIDALAACKNLREVDFSWCGNSTTGSDETFHKLFSSCEGLEKIFLAAFRGLTDRDLKALTLCKHLKQLDLLGALSLTPEICDELFLNCSKLEMMDLSFCDKINDYHIEQWQKAYPHVAIKRIREQYSDSI